MLLLEGWWRVEVGRWRRLLSLLPALGLGVDGGGIEVPAICVYASVEHVSAKLERSITKAMDKKTTNAPIEVRVAGPFTRTGGGFSRTWKISWRGQLLMMRDLLSLPLFPPHRRSHALFTPPHSTHRRTTTGAGDEVAGLGVCRGHVAADGLG